MENNIIKFGTDGWRATLTEFTNDRVQMVGQAVSTYLDDHNQEGLVAIGYDAREHSRGFADELATVLAGNGRPVVISDRDCPTPALAWTVARGNFAGGLVITASHNPPEYNGVKYLVTDGSPALPAVTDELEQRLEPPQATESDRADIREQDVVTPYAEHVSTFLTNHFGISQTLDGLTVAYDAMHGSGRGVTDEVLENAGAIVQRRRCDRHPEFGGTAPEPTPENAADLVTAVQKNEVDLGLVNDGDADRVGIVTPDRGFLDPNIVLALVYDYLLEYADGDVVRTVSTSSLVDRIATSHGHEVYETPVGFKWVAEAMGEYNALVGGEESGGYGVTEHLPNKDGVFLGLLAAVMHAEQPLDDRIKELLATYGEIHQGKRSLGCSNEKKQAALRAIEDNIPESIAGTAVGSVNSVDGIKLVLDAGDWMLIRPSGTEPKLRVYAEANSEHRVEELLSAGQAFIRPLIPRE